MYAGDYDLSKVTEHHYWQCPICLNKCDTKEEAKACLKFCSRPNEVYEHKREDKGVRDG